MKSSAKILSLCLMTMMLTWCWGLSGCATVASGGWGSGGGRAASGDATPAGMAAPCSDFLTKNASVSGTGMVTMNADDTGKPCGAMFGSESGASQLIVNSQPVPPRSNLTLLCDLFDGRPNTGPAAAGGAAPQPFKLAIGPGGWYGTKDPSKTQQIWTASGHWIRHSAHAFVDEDQVPKSVTAVLSFTGKVRVGRCGWFPG